MSAERIRLGQQFRQAQLLERVRGRMVAKVGLCANKQTVIQGVKAGVLSKLEADQQMELLYQNEMAKEWGREFRECDRQSRQISLNASYALPTMAVDFQRSVALDKIRGDSNLGTDHIASYNNDFIRQSGDLVREALASQQEREMAEDLSDLTSCFVRCGFAGTVPGVTRTASKV